MKNVLRAGLLAVLFVGMSGFVFNNSSIDQDTQKGEMLRPNCEDEAMFAYYAVKGGSPYISQDALNDVFSTIYWDCINNKGGESDFTANP